MGPNIKTKRKKRKTHRHRHKIRLNVEDTTPVDTYLPIIIPTRSSFFSLPRTFIKYMYGKWINKALIKCVDCLAGLLSNDRTWRTPSTSHDIAWLFEIKLLRYSSVLFFLRLLAWWGPDCWHLDGLERPWRSWVLIFTTTSHLQLIRLIFPLSYVFSSLGLFFLPPISGLSPVSFPIRPSEIVRLLYRYFPAPSPNRRNIIFLPILLFLSLYIPPSSFPYILYIS